MNRRMVFNVTGYMAIVNAALLVLPIIVSIIYGESCVLSFLITAGISLALGLVMVLLFRPKNQVIYAKEGYAIVALAWLLTSGLGALPFVISGEIPNFVDAWFETVSGFTTTGASILRDVEVLSRGILFWRSFTHWVGGMGVLVFIMAIIPNIADRSIHIMRAEVPGPVVGKLVPRIKDTAKILYLIYIALTLVEMVMLALGGMPIFDSIVHSFGTAGTGGFGIKGDSIGGYSPYCQWIITIFMLIFGVNFNIYYLIIIRRLRSAFRSGELWCYLGIVLVSVGIITVNIYPMFDSLADSLRNSAFQVSSIITTTGYATANFDLWPGLSKSILLLLMFVGGCAGSTAGGLKVSRIVLLFKTISAQIKKMLHPRSVTALKFEGKTVDKATTNGVTIYLAIYIMCFAAIFFILSFEPFSMETNFSATSACFNNVGPGFAAVGPAANYADYSIISKIVLSIAMLLGRLEIFPLLISLLPATWIKK